MSVTRAQINSLSKRDLLLAMAWDYAEQAFYREKVYRNIILEDPTPSHHTKDAVKWTWLGYEVMANEMLFNANRIQGDSDD